MSIDRYRTGWKQGWAMAQAGIALWALPLTESDNHQGLRHGWLDCREDSSDVLIFRGDDCLWAYVDADEAMHRFETIEALREAHPQALDMCEDLAQADAYYQGVTRR